MQLIDKDKCLEQIMDITEDIEHSNSNMSESDIQKRNIDRITKAEHICRNIDYDDDNASYNHDDFHV